MSEHSYIQSKYLVCVDHTDVSRSALRFACSKARKRNIRIDVLHVMPPVDGQLVGAVADKMRQEQRADAEKLLQSLAHEAVGEFGITPSLLIREGIPADQILAQTQEDYFTNMLVLGVSPQSSGRRKVINTLTNYYADKLHIPIMLVPGNMTDEEMDKLG